MGTTTRQQIQAFIAEQGVTTSAEISRKFHLSQAAIRYHIDALIQQGEIETVQDISENRNRGHPARRLKVPLPHRPHDLENLCKGLLLLLTNHDQGMISIQLANEIAKNLTGPQQPIPAAPTQRIKKALDFFVTHHYQPDWEARACGPRLRFHNCPFSTIIVDFPDLCQVDHSLLSLLSGGRIVQVEKINPNLPSRTSCVFDITPDLKKAR